ncbi:MAG: hypothetical protein HDR71_10570 [Lachnospiraceae bacterium]|nr:hypothetical protein [Lachnospiraceae bacterium]
MKGKVIGNTIKLDFIRAFRSWKFPVSILLGTAVCYFTLLFCGDYKSPAIHKFIYMHDRSQSFLAYIVGILPFAFCFYDDLKFGNIRNVAGRIPLRLYVFSKTLIACIAAICAFVLGKLLFVALYSFDTPVCTPGTLNMIPNSILYIEMIRNQDYFAFFLTTSFHKALYCGLLCQVVMLVSILIPNKSVMLSIPVAFFYVFNFYVNNNLNSDLLNFTRIFDGITCLWDKDSYCFLYAVVIAALSCFILYRLTLRILRKKVYNE